MSNRKRKIFGYLFMLLGIFFPLYSFIHLSLGEWNAKENYRQFISASQRIEENEKEKINEEIEHYQSSMVDHKGVIIDPFDTEDYSSQYITEMKDEIFAYLSIPKLDLQKGVRFGASQEHLALGLAHVEGTDIPKGGKGQRTVIAGHRGTYKDVMFLNLHTLEQGDEVKIETITGETLHYLVKEKELIAPYEWEKLLPEADKDILTLLTCDPIIPPNSKRLLVHCERIEKEQPNQSLDEDSSSLVHTPQNTSKPSGMTILIYVITLGLFIAFGWTTKKFLAFLK